MDVREKLVKLLDIIIQPGQKTLGDIADYLIANGVTVQECKLASKKTNVDRVRSMSDEELAIFLCNFRSCDADEYICEGCKAEKYCRAGHEGTIDWLQQPAEVSE